MSTKTCDRCRRVLPVEAFNRARRRRDGLAVCCRECAVAAQRAYRRRNRERINREKREAYAATRGSLERVCANPDCGETFVATRTDRKTCSRRCRDHLAWLGRKRRLDADRQQADSAGPGSGDAW